jgi:hypothetical protein
MSANNLTFADIVNLLNALYNNDPHIGRAPHKTFWQNTSRDAFVSLKTDDWEVDGALVTLGDPNKSNLYLSLAGLGPFDGSQVNQMPDTNRYPQARHATATELSMVATWINNSAPGCRCTSTTETAYSSLPSIHRAGPYKTRSE